jgi:D-glycerate 3-kinase
VWCDSRAASISIDDFYLTAAGQKELAASNSGNRLLEMRGNAGSHDLQLGTETLEALRSLTMSGLSSPTSS